MITEKSKIIATLDLCLKANVSMTYVIVCILIEKDPELKETFIQCINQSADLWYEKAIKAENEAFADQPLKQALLRKAVPPNEITGCYAGIVDDFKKRHITILNEMTS